MASPLVAPANALVSREVLSNGITLVTRLDKTAPRVAISLLVRAGAVDETPATAGWRRVLTESMLRASLRDGQAEKVVTGTQMQRLAEEVGGRIGASVGDDVIEFWATGDSSNAAALLDLLLTVVQHPRLSEADVKAATERTLERIEGERDDVAALATAALRSQIYRDARGELLAYGLSNTGTLESLNNLTRDKLLDFYKRHFAASRFAVSLAGDLPSTIMRARLEKIAAGTAFPATMVPPSLFASPTQSEPALIVRQMPTRDAWIFVSFRVAASTNKADEPALRVLVSALGEGPSARLQRRMSAQSANTVMGRVFGIDTVAGASLTPRRFGGEMVLFAQTNSAGIDEAKNALLDEVRKLKETAMSETELQRARNFARGSWAVDRESLRDRAFQAGLVAALNPVPVIAPGAASISVANDWDWPSRVSAVSAADVRRVANKYLNAYAVALIMPED